MKKRTLSRAGLRERGFALVISIMLMVLLTVLAVGLLGLSSISMRSSTQEEALRLARSNARVALSLAIAQLQKQAGPDQRITAPATITNVKNPRGVTGVWKSWRPPQENPDYAKEKAERFTEYLISTPTPGKTDDIASVPTSDEEQVMVGAGSLGGGSVSSTALTTDETTNEIMAPVVPVAAENGKSTTGALAWATLDEGVKGRIDLAPAEDPKDSVADAVSRMGSPARNKAGSLDGLAFLDDARENLLEKLPKLVSTAEVNLAGGDKEVFGRYFHDFSVASNSVQADVANGGLKTDLSVIFDGATLPTEYATRRLYSNSAVPATGTNNSDPMWAAYQHYYRLYQKAVAKDNPKDGMKAFVPTTYRLAQSSDTTIKDVRIEPNLSTVRQSILMPTVAKVDIVFSIVARDVHSSRTTALLQAGYPYMIHLMYLPVITLHNPYNVPLRFTEMEVEFADLPMGFQFFVNGQAATNEMKPFNSLYTGNESGGAKKVFKVTLTGDLKAAKEVVMGAGETRIFGKPFPPEWTWAQENAGGAQDGVDMFDWRNDRTQLGNRIMPGMITGPNDGIGYDLDWLAPLVTTRAEWHKARTAEGVLPVKPGESIMVKYGPKTQPSSPNNKFAMTLRLKNGTAPVDYGTTQVYFQNEGKLKTVLEEGTSPRFTEARSFPESYPKPGVEAPITASSIYESNSTKIRDYSKARPFAVFSLSGKTTQEAFTRSRPAADTGAAPQMATCEFISTASQGTNPYEFILTPVRGGNAVIESEGEKGYFFGGHGATRGTTAATFFEIPMAPLQSLAQLRHANVGTMAAAPYFTYATGESRAHPALPAKSPRFAVATNRTILDHSWLSNDQLWDRYWFSTIATLQGPAYAGSSAKTQTELAKSFFNGEGTLPNVRNMAIVPTGSLPDDVATTAIEAGGQKSAMYLLTRGGFNVNSTSEAAWVSVLSAMADSPVPLATGMLESTGDSVPLLRTRRPSTGLDGGVVGRDQLWNSYRKLTPEEVRSLAKEMVKQVRQRGPFLSMSDFVNRRLAEDDTGKAGAMQAAIDASGINEVMVPNAMPIDPAEVTKYGWRNPKALEGSNTAAGSPGAISQGDVLSAIGSFATVRSDTFRIRAYGEARDPQGKVLARAWCEATLQRLPDYVDPSESPEIIATKEANVTFGRRFETLAFRWLHPEEV
ncbi:hypothetical protein OKA04_22045 [Luteolibacter flavescens]|uniref:Verru_Chthon cassette protein A n=1 Tax=Luteolibacter flavescens TaxID=1859460 RepID=A0ABT3FW32_9BACT|nr:pilus assembly PilX N-terminal domain-containing protein [Luteolibacter flavescens]MCW1887434.1 hypothetical protein [Luteolibacter flavescens]